jgi:integrase
MKKLPWGAGSINGPDRLGRYEVRISLGSLDGKRRRVNARVSSMPAARAKLVELQARYGQSRGTGAPPKLADYFASWLDQKKQSLEPKTIRNYEFGISLVSGRIGHVRIDRLTHDQIRGALAGLSKDGKGDRTVQVAYDTLRAALNWAVKRDGILAANPLVRVQRPAAEREIDFLTRDEAKAFLAAVADDRYRAVFHVAIGLGLRLGEICGLHWRDVDLENATLTVVRSLKESRKIGKTKSKSSKRRIDLPKSVIAELRAHQKRNLKMAKATDLVFHTVTGTALHDSNFERRHFFPALERAALRRVRFHDLRHTAAALRLLAGEHVAVIQAMLGHSSIRTTIDTYGHLAPSLGKEAAGRYDALMD